MPSNPPNSPEPSSLFRGKAFHKQIQAEWAAEAEGDPVSEATITKPSGRKGRVDVLVDAGDMMAVVEIKASDWDAMQPQNVQRNIRRQIKQVWDYIESQLAEDKDVSPGIIFPKRPTTPGRLELIEQQFGEEGIPVVWHDESPQERKARLVTSPLV